MRARSSYLMQAGPTVRHNQTEKVERNKVLVTTMQIVMDYDNPVQPHVQIKASYQKRWPHKLITASLDVSKQILHSNVLSWLLLSPCAWLLEPAAVLSVAAEPDGGEALAMMFLNAGNASWNNGLAKLWRKEKQHIQKHPQVMFKFTTHYRLLNILKMCVRYFVSFWISIKK